MTYKLATIAVAAALVFASSAVADLVTGVAVAEIVQRWAAANRVDFEASEEYGYSEHIRDDDGIKTYQITRLFGSPYRQLVAMNGKPLSEAARNKQQEAFIQERVKRANESSSERAKRIAEYQKKRERARRIIEELPRAFRYTLGRNRRVGSRMLFVLRANPRPDYDAPNVEAAILSGMRGEFWIDTGTYQLYRGFAHVLRPISIASFLATVQPGTEFEVEQRPVASGIWLPTHLEISSRSSIVWLFHHHTHEVRDYFDYRRGSDSDSAK